MHVTTWIRRLFRLPSLEEMEMEQLSAADNITVRILGQRDPYIPDLLALSRDCSTDPLTRAELEARLAGFCKCYIAERYGMFAGYLLLGFAADSLCVVEICVAPEHRGFGVGTRLIGKAMSKLDGTRNSIHAAVHRGNREAIGFLRSHGFLFSERVKGREDAFWFDFQVQENG
jgi:ribosomal protein S18 acetylase RimI-like enzyme